jgi:hypothetical protein
MQDAAVAATACIWGAEHPARHPALVRCADGHVCIETTSQDSDGALAQLRLRRDDAARMERASLAALAHGAGIAAASILSIGEVAASPQAIARRLIVEARGEDGRTWPLLNSPLRLSRTPARVRKPIGPLVEANAAGRIPPKTVR